MPFIFCIFLVITAASVALSLPPAVAWHNARTGNKIVCLHLESVSKCLLPGSGRKAGEEPWCFSGCCGKDTEGWPWQPHYHLSDQAPCGAGAEAEEFLRNTHLTCTQTSEPLTRAALMCGQNKVSPSGRAPADHSVHVQVAHRAEFWGLRGHSDESPEAM